MHSHREISKELVSSHCKQRENWTKYMKQAFSDIGEWAVQDCDPREKGNERGESLDCPGFLPGGVYQTPVPRENPRRAEWSY